MTDKSHMFISVHTEKAFDRQNQHCIMMNTSNKLGKKATF